MIPLTDEQRQALRQTGDRAPVPVYDAQTGQTYFLLPGRLYERVRGQLEGAAGGEDLEVPAGIRCSKATFLRDLPELLRNKKLRDRWVAYHGDRRLGFGRDGRTLYHECLRRGLTGDDFYVGLIQPYEPEPEEAEYSLFEFDEETEDTCRKLGGPSG